MEDMELLCFQIISRVGTARSMFIEAIKHAKNGDFDEAKKLIEEGDSNFVEGHHLHVQLIQDEANGIKQEIGILLIHAEDQLMSAETLKIIAEEFIDLYKKLKKEGN